MFARSPYENQLRRHGQVTFSTCNLPPFHLNVSLGMWDVQNQQLEILHNMYMLVTRMYTDWTFDTYVGFGLSTNVILNPAQGVGGSTFNIYFNLDVSWGMCIQN